MTKLFKILSSLVFFLALMSAVKGQNAISDVALARQFYNNGEYDKSLTIYQKLYQSKGGDDLYFDEYFNTLLRLKKYPEAEKIVNKKIKDNFKYGIELGQLYLEKGDVDKATKAFDEVLAKMPKDEFAITGIANAFYGI